MAACQNQALCRFDINGARPTLWLKGRPSYVINTITIYNDEDGSLIQKISIPELTLLGNTNISDWETLGVTFIDVNFDGYLDFRQYDSSNGNRNHDSLLFFV